MQRVVEGSRLVPDVLPPACGVAEGTNDPNQEGRGGRTSSADHGGCRRVAAATAEGAESCRQGCLPNFYPVPKIRVFTGSNWVCVLPGTYLVCMTAAWMVPETYPVCCNRLRRYPEPTRILNSKPQNTWNLPRFRVGIRV